jgi:hypothetical protein
MRLLIEPDTPPREVSRSFAMAILSFGEQLERKSRRFVQWVKIGGEETEGDHLNIVFVAKVEE